MLFTLLFGAIPMNLEELRQCNLSPRKKPVAQGLPCMWSEKQLSSRRQNKRTDSRRKWETESKGRYDRDLACNRKATANNIAFRTKIVTA